VVVRERLRRGVRRWLSAADGAGWLDRLPSLVLQAARRFDVQIGPPFDPGGQLAWVAPVRRHDGSDAVLKVSAPHPEADHEAAALAAWDGDGAIRLLGVADDLGALLLERCAPGSALLEAEAEAVAPVGAELAARLHRAAPPPGLPSLTDVLGGWADETERVAAATGRLDGDDLLVLGLHLMRTAPDEVAPEGQVLLHGDLNPTNVLRARRGSWLAIDPQAMVGDPAYDGVRVVLQPDPLATKDPAATLRGRLAVVAEEMQVDHERLRRWCLAQAVQLAVSADPVHSHVDGATALAHARLVADLA
jgi:streptomycin 6-kinase